MTNNDGKYEIAAPVAIPISAIPRQFAADMKGIIAVLGAEPHGRRIVAHGAAWIATSLLMLAAVSLVGGDQLFEQGYHPGSVVTLGDLSHMTVSAAFASLLVAVYIVLQVWFVGRLIGLCLVGPNRRGPGTS